MKAKLRRFLHRLFFVVLALGTLVVLFYAEENWRGARAWAAAKRDLAAQGESLDLKTLIPPPVPDDQNLAMAPLFVRAFEYGPDPVNGVLTFAPGKSAPGQSSNSPTKEELLSMFFGPNPPLNSNYPPSRSALRWSTGYHRNLAAWQRFYRQNPALPHTPEPQTPAADMLLALSRSALLLDELARAAAERPLTRFPVNWTLRPPANINFSHQNVLNVIVLTLGLRASARLAAGEVAPARQDLLLALRLTDDLSKEPVLISAVNEKNWVEALAQPLWDGLKERQWSAADLMALQAGFGRLDLLRSLQDALRGERAAFFVETMEDMQNTAVARRMVAEVAGPSPDNPPDTFWKAVRWTLHIPDSPKRALWNFLPYGPRGWILQNAALGCRLSQAQAIDLIDVKGGFVHSEKEAAFERQTKALPLRPGNMLVGESGIWYASISVRLVPNQGTLNEAITACALERFFLDHGDYPATLAELVPTYLDRVRPDPVDGAPLRYRRTVDGRFVLYSVGNNGRDDGGAIVWPADRAWRHGDPVYPEGKQPGLPRPDLNESDRVWQYAPAEPPEPPANVSRLEARP